MVAPIAGPLGVLASPGGQLGQALAGTVGHYGERAGQGIGGELALLAALAQARGADAGVPGFDPNSTATLASRAALAQGFGHPGRAMEAIRSGPDPGMAWLAGALEMVSNPTNLIPVPGHGAAKAAEEALPAAAPSVERLVAGLADRAAAREALTTASEKVTGKAGGLPLGKIPKVGGVRQYGPVPPPPTALPFPPQATLPALSAPPPPPLAQLARLAAPVAGSNDQRVIGMAALKGGTPTLGEIQAEFKVGAAEALRLQDVAAGRGAAAITPPAPEVGTPGPRWTHYGPETIHPGEDVTPELLDRFAKLRQFPNPSSLDIESEIGAMRDPVTLLQQHYGNDWQHRLAALTGGKWGQPGSGAQLVNGRIMLGDLDLTTAVRDYLENRGGTQAGDFKGALKALLPDKSVQAAQETAPANFAGTLDDVRNLIQGEAQRVGTQYPPLDPAFYAKRANVDPARVPAMLDQLVNEGTLGRLPDGSLAVKPGAGAALSNVDIPPSVTAPAERAAWQAKYAGQSQAGTDILAAGDKVGASDLTQAGLNAMSPQERMAALRKLAAIEPSANPGSRLAPTKAATNLETLGDVPSIAKAAGQDYPYERQLPDSGGVFRTKMAPGAKLPTFSRGDEEGAIYAAQRYAADRPLYVVPTNNGFAIDTRPPVGRDILAVLPDGTVQRTPYEFGKMDPALAASVEREKLQEEFRDGLFGALERDNHDEVRSIMALAPEYGYTPAEAQKFYQDFLDDSAMQRVDVQRQMIEQSPYFGVFKYFNRDGTLKKVNPQTGARLVLRGEGGKIAKGADEVWNIPTSGYDEVAAQALASPSLGHNQNFGQTSDEFWRNAQAAFRQYQALKKPGAAFGGDLAAGGGGFGLLPARLAPTLAGAAAGTGLGGLAGGGLGLAAGHDPDQLKADVAAGAGLGALAGGSVGSASPEIAQAADHLATQVGAKFGDTALDPGLWADAIKVGWRTFQDVRGTAGVNGPKEAWNAFWAQWRSQVVNTLKQVPQDAATRKFVQEGIARQEFGLTDGDIRAFQGVLRRERADGTGSLANPLTARLRALGATGVLGDMPGVYGVDFGTELGQEAGKQFGGLGRALAGAGIGLGSGIKTVNPLAPVYGAARGYAAPFVDGMIRYINGIQHDAFRYALATKALDRDVPQLADGFLRDLAARGVATAQLAAKGGYFSPEEVAAVAGPQAGKDWATLLEATIKGQGDRIAFLAGDFRQSSETGAERAIGKAVPFARWSIRYAPVLAEIAARHPVATLYVLREMDREKDVAAAQGKQAYQSGLTISDKTPLVGLAARVRDGGGAGTLTVDPLGMLVPFGDIGGGSDLPADATGYQRATDLAGRVGFQPNPAIQAAMYVAGQGRAPSALSRTAGLEGLADTLPVLARAGLRATGNPDLADRVPDLALPGGRTLLDAARGVVAPAVEAAGLPTTGGGPSDPAERRYAELVLARTQKPLSDPSNRRLLETMGDADNPLWQMAILQSRTAGAIGNATSLTSPAQTTAQTSQAAAAQAAPKLPFTSYAISQAPAARRPAMLAANAAAARANPASATYVDIAGKSRTDRLVAQWEADHQGLKRMVPELYAQRLAVYKASIK